MLTLNLPKKPFGLLSPKADTPFLYENRVWPTVNHFNYINVFQNEKLKQRMSDHIFKNPHVFMYMIKNTFDEEMYKKFLYLGLQKRFEQNAELRKRLADTKGYELVYPDSELLAFLYNLRDSSKVLDSLRNIEVEKKEVECVYEGVTRALLNNEKINPNSTYQDLLPYKTSFCVPLPPDDKIFININHMVPIIQHRNKTEIWIRELLRFKKHLLDVYLDHILETEYPEISSTNYTLAKNQQLLKEPNIARIENQLYNLYIEGEIDYQITKRLLFEPDMTLEEQAKEAMEVESLMHSDNSENSNKKVFIENDDPFLPQYIEPFKVDEIWFPSSVHYAYSKLFETIKLPNNILNIDKINDISLDEIQRVYNYEKSQYLKSRLKQNNEIATLAKFDAWPELKYLLALTDDKKITYDDKTDPILGTGMPEQENLVGRFLQYKRSNDKIIQPVKLSDNMSENIWFNSWLKEYTNYLEQVKNILIEEEQMTKNIAKLVNVKLLNQFPSMTNKDALFFNSLGISPETLNILYPIIVSKYFTFSQTANPLKTAIDYYKNTLYKRNNSQLKTLYRQMSDTLKISEKDFLSFFKNVSI